MLRDLDNDAASILRGRCPVDLAAELLHGGFELFEIAIEMGERVIADIAADVTQSFVPSTL